LLGSSGGGSFFEKVALFLAGAGGAFAYGTVFVLLFFAGWLVPLPEEPTVIAAGYITAKNGLSLPIMLAVVLAGIQCGDVMIYFIGRRHGDWVFRLRLFRWLLPPERLEKARRLFAEHGSKMAFFGRFIAGIRLVVFFTAGNLGVPLGTFIFYDFLAIVLTIPIGVVAGWYFADHIDRAFVVMKQSHRIAIAVALLIVVIFAVKRWLAARALRREKAAAAVAAAPAPTQATGISARNESVSVPKGAEHA
jgi:membrane protein DedA with SNARE-associated domain